VQHNLKKIKVNIRYHTHACHWQRGEADHPLFSRIASSYRPRKDGFGRFIGAISDSHKK
jgi:hypothetical protein